MCTHILNINGKCSRVKSLKQEVKKYNFHSFQYFDKHIFFLNTETNKSMQYRTLDNLLKSIGKWGLHIDRYIKRNEIETADHIEGQIPTESIYKKLPKKYDVYILTVLSGKEGTYVNIGSFLF